MRLVPRTRRASVVTVAVGAVLAVALPALAYWTFSQTHGTSFTAGTLPASQVTVPAYSSGTVSISWAAVAGPGGNPVDGYYVQRLAGTTPSAACGTTQSSLTTGLSCAETVGAGTYTYRVYAVFRSWSTPVDSSAVVVDTTAPGAFAASLTNATGSSYVSGSVAYTNPQAGFSGGFTVSAGPTDAESGIEDVTFPSLAGFASGGGADATAPYSTTYAWSGAGATASGAQTVTARNKALLPTATTFTVTPDTAAPVGGAVTAADSATGTVGVSKTDYTDALSGIATSAFTRAAGTLSGGGCGTLSGTSLVTVSGGNDTASLTTGCYQYTLTATDNVGNAATAQSSVVKVDTTAPAFTISATGTNVGFDGSTVYFRAGSGSFTVTANDADSGVASSTFPSFTGWTASGSGPTRTYTLTASTPGSATASASATNGVGTTATQSIATVLQTVTPAASDIQGSGNGNSKIDSGDVLTLTFNTVVRPSSILSGWSGSSTNVTFDPVDGSNDTATVTGTSLGTIDLGGNYVGNGVGNDYALSATMTMTTVSGKSVVTITMTSSDNKAATSTGNKTLKWATTTSVRDWGNTAATTTQASELGGGDADF